MMYGRNKKQFKPVTGGMKIQARPAKTQDRPIRVANESAGGMQARPLPIPKPENSVENTLAAIANAGSPRPPAKDPGFGRPAPGRPTRPGQKIPRPSLSEAMKEKIQGIGNTRPVTGKLEKIMDARPAQDRLQNVRNEQRMQQLAQKLSPEANLRKRVLRLRRGA